MPWALRTGIDETAALILQKCFGWSFLRRRRDFITLMSGAVAAWPLAARAQQTDRVRRVGVLSNFAESDPEAQSMVDALHQTLQELGWVEGRNLRIDRRWAAGNPTRLQARGCGRWPSGSTKTARRCTATSRRARPRWRRSRRVGGGSKACQLLALLRKWTSLAA